MVAKNGHLILAANTLGTLDQLPEATCTLLREAQLVIFEEDRPGRQTLKKAGVHREYLKYNEHKSEDTVTQLRDCLTKGETALYMSDQGMPNIADPGRELLACAYQLGAKVTVIPGACSVTAALAACPELKDQYLYYGFLPREPEERRSELTRLLELPFPSVVLETPYRYRPLVDDLAACAGKARKVLLAVDIAGPDQGFYWLKVAELAAMAESIHKKLNFVIVISPQAGSPSGRKSVPRGYGKKPTRRKNSAAKPRPKPVAPRGK